MKKLNFNIIESGNLKQTSNLELDLLQESELSKLIGGQDPCFIDVCGVKGCVGNIEVCSGKVGILPQPIQR